MEPKFIELPRILVAGVPYYGDPSDGQFAKMWEILNGMAGQIANQKIPVTHFGVESYTEEFQTKGKWFYLAGVEVTSLDVIPIGAVAKIIPANTYAVFTHTGPLPGTLGETFHYAYHQWLPESGYTQAAAYDLERYDERFLGPTNPHSVMEVCIPVRPV